MHPTIQKLALPAILVVGLLTGCGSTSDTGSSTTETITPADPSSQVSDSDTPSTPGPSEGGWTPPVVTIEDEAGYSYEFRVSAGISAPGSTDVTNAPPGDTDWTRPVVAGTVTQTNTTPGRTESAAHLTISAYWIVDADACREALPYASAIQGAGDGKVFCPLGEARSERADHLEFDDLQAGGHLDQPVTSSSIVARVSEATGTILAEVTAQEPDAWLVSPDFTGDEQYRFAWPVYDGMPAYASAARHAEFTVVAQMGLPAPCKDLGCAE